jgi:hypothetical protein
MNFHRLRFNNVKNNQISSPPTNEISQFVPIGFRRFPTAPPSIKRNIEPLVLDPMIEDKKMKWGEPTWFFFHTVAEKIKDDMFPSVRTDIIEHIKVICNNLPCPKCSEHATEYMKKVNINSIRTKSDLQLMLFQFHNVVNKKKRLDEFPLSQLKEKYSNANLVNIVYNFMNYFGEKSNNPTLIASQMYKTRFIQLLKKWFNEHINDFDL